ncbi:TonB-linked SusC/RagA family outer membrane protein [Flavobacterium sp. 270]|uniref:SusC/RagA family TonB-linked outer membrane protein n=1 Tax=Flavobacterium sp. 270 TaxID=2512114 RepID=UPI001066C874|nr:TonB-dependent receptor [Flavobacterium sp. 270]TDW48967.1 TonB-linked SusC/RagA family outer membrane protein [Flavobacterium sp. 270]
MNKQFNILVSFCIFLISIGIKAQNAQPTINSTLNGTVIDQVTNQPIPGVTVQIKGTTHSAVTDLDGKFYFQTGQKFPYTLVVSYIGYITVTQDATTDFVQISLKEDVKELDEIVIIGYGSTTKKDYTGAAETVATTSLKASQRTLESALQGSVAGVNVTQTSGQPGAGLSIRVRGGSSIQGGNEPLYVIDGFPLYNSDVTSGVLSGTPTNPLSSINPSDIESITVLKDASSTAIYGSRGANGVVIITTKKGSNNAMTVNYEFTLGQQEVRKKIDLLDATGFSKLRNAALYDSNPAGGPNQYLSDAQIAALGKGVDWQDAAFQKGITQNHQLSVSGGNNQTKYSVSGNYYNQEGIIKNTGFERLSGRVNLTSKLTSRSRFGLNLTIAETKAKVAPTGLVTALLSMPPTATIYEPDGSYTLRNPFENIFANPIATLNERKNQSITDRILGTVYGEYDLLKNLVLKVSFGADAIFNKEKSYLPASIYEGSITNGEGKIGNADSKTWLNENTLTYTTVFGEKHHLNALVGYTQQNSVREFVTSGAQQFVNDVTYYYSLQSGNLALLPSSGESTWALNSYLSRVNYNYDSKYFLTGSLRADGSSRFGKNNKWGYFPSVAAAWQVSNEAFFDPIKDVVNSLKIRSSWGATGNQEIGEYQSLSTLTSVKYLFGDQIYTGFTPTSIANDDLGWELTNQFDAGLDVGFFNDKLNLTVDFYRKTTKNLLLAVQIPYTTGFTSSLQNFGSVQNQGIEFGINTALGNKAFSWTSNFNIAFNKNKIIALGNDAEFYTFGNYILKVGESLGTFYGAVTDGILQTADVATKGAYTGNATPKAGDRLYKDINGDGAFTTAADRTSIGNAQPDFTFGFSNNFTFRGFELAVLINGSVGNKILNGNLQALELYNGQQNASTSALDAWTPTNPSTSTPRAKLDPAPVFSNRFVEDGSFVRLKNIALAYNLPKRWSEKLNLTNIKFRVIAENLVTITKYSGYDPEVTNGTTISPGTDTGIYPASKTISGSLNITF